MHISIKFNTKIMGFVEKGEMGKTEVYKMFENMNDFRCPRCNKLLFRYRLKGSLEVQVKCTRCNTIAVLKEEKS